MQVTCPICEKHTRDVDDHVWHYHVPYRSCWCGFSVEQASPDLSEDVRVFSDHCYLRGGYLVHYLECQLGGEDASHVPHL
jgi:transcription elongation factor Elf1